MANALICEPCGATVPLGRHRCGRCGAPLTAAARVPAGSAPGDGTAASGSGRPGRAVAIGALALACAGAIPLMMGTPRANVAVESPVAAATPAAAPVAGERPSYTPSGVFAAGDANREGTVAYTSGNFASAAEQYRAAVAADPTNPEALNNLGQVLVRDGESRQAIEYFDRAIAAEPGIWAYHFNRARAYGELEDWPEAIDGYEDAERLFPGDYVTQFNLARAREAYGDLSGAINGYARAIQLAPGEADFHLWHGQALDKNGQGAAAAAAYRQYLELAPDSSRAEQVKARLAQLAGPDEAVS